MFLVSTKCKASLHRMNFSPPLPIQHLNKCDKYKQAHNTSIYLGHLWAASDRWQWQWPALPPTFRYHMTVQSVMFLHTLRFLSHDSGTSLDPWLSSTPRDYVCMQSVTYDRAFELVLDHLKVGAQSYFFKLDVENLYSTGLNSKFHFNRPNHLDARSNKTVNCSCLYFTV